MKYLITQSQLDKIIFRYLDKRGLYKMGYDKGYVFWESKESWESGGYIIITANRDRSDCFVSSDLLVEVATMFSLELSNCLDIVGEWINTQIDFNVEYFFSDY